MTRAKDISKILTDADISGTLDVTGNLTVTGSSTFDDIKLTTVALPSAGNPSIALRDTNNIVYHQSGSGNSIVLLDSSQNTMYNVSSNTHIFNTGNSERMRLDDAGLMINTSTAFNHLNGRGDIVVGDGSSNGGMTIFTGSSNQGSIVFADGTSGDQAYRGMIEYDHSNDSMAFKIGVSERLRIQSDGETFLNTTTHHGDASELTIRGAGSNNGGIIELQHNRGSGSNRDFIRFYNSSGGEAGGIEHSSSTGVSYQTSSDYRLKENVSYDFDATTRLKQLKPCRFNFIEEADRTVDGFLAHEVSGVVPEAIGGEKDAVKVWGDGEKLPDGVSVGDNKLDADGNTIPIIQGIDHSRLVPLLVKTIQELEARITALEGA
jgi:hypothetical protein